MFSREDIVLPFPPAPPAGQITWNGTKQLKHFITKSLNHWWFCDFSSGATMRLTFVAFSDTSAVPIGNMYSYRKVGG